MILSKRTDSWILNVLSTCMQQKHQVWYIANYNHLYNFYSFRKTTPNFLIYEYGDVWQGNILPLLSFLLISMTKSFTKNIYWA